MITIKNEWLSLKSFPGFYILVKRFPKSKVLSMDQVNEFLSKASDDECLMVKVALIIGLADACRSTELVDLLTSRCSRFRLFVII
ncbi:hypothetical protein Zmor_006911 [Zophobas morio]|uniref:Uncharacterized protein n=1 Tax=Zophobas morio TaxID=2755281 RepID=A0AA38IX63_9CUCU|nr:hypothetical protein Zmor_006911 [Zophobas morio]